MNRPSQVLRVESAAKPWITGLGLMVLTLSAIWLGFFFWQVNSTLSDASWGDVSLYNQMSYNLTHGRPFQLSLNRQGGPGVLFNPSPYVHSFSIHQNLTPVLFMPLYRLLPQINGLYLLTIFFNLLGFFFVGRLVLSKGLAETSWLKFVFCLSILFCLTPFLSVITYKGHFPLFAGPFILATYLLVLTQRPFPFLIMSLLVCGISEDLSMFMVTFSVYLLIFEKTFRKPALGALVLSATYVCLALLVVQPWSRTGLTLEHGSDSLARANMLLHGQMTLFSKDPLKLLAGIAVATVVLLLLCPDRRGIDWRRLAGLVFIAPASHWLICLTQGAGHHMLPILSMVFIAFLVLASQIEMGPMPAWRGWLIACLCLVCFVPNAIGFGALRAIRGFRTPESRHRWETNREVLGELRKIPKKASLTYWTNRGLDGFISARSDVWRFPDYYDATDYLVIQKDADESLFMPAMAPGLGLDEALAKGAPLTSGAKTAIPAQLLSDIVDRLVRQRASHQLVTDDEHVVVLRLKVPGRMSAAGAR